MKALEVLLSKRWILKSRDRELYYSVRDELPKFKSFLIEKLGFQVVVNSYLIKLEKIPAVAENWMGIKEFSDCTYVFGRKRYGRAICAFRTDRIHSDYSRGGNYRLDSLQK